MQGIQYYACIQLLRLFVCIVVDLVKHGVLKLADDIRRYRHDRIIISNCKRCLHDLSPRWKGDKSCSYGTVPILWSLNISTRNVMCVCVCV